MATLVSVNVGLPKDVAWNGRTVYTGVWKQPVTGPRMVRRLNVDGDGQGDLGGMVENTGRCWSINLTPIGIGQTNCIATTSNPAFRRELHGRGFAGRRGVHRGPIPHRACRLRSHPTAGHLLPGRPATGEPQMATVDYTLEPLEPPAPGNILLCCARPAEPIVVDL